MKALRFLRGKWKEIAIVVLLLNLLVGTALPALADVIRIQAQPGLDNLTDVNVPTPADGDLLAWDNGASEWVDIAHIDLTTGVHGLGDYTSTTSTITAVNLYVDAGSGNDGNAGTSGSPKATIQGALDALPVVIAHTSTINVRGQQDYAESNTALDFSRFNTLDIIVIKAVNSNDEDMYDYGLATGGGADDLDDSGASWSANQFNGAYIWIYRGTGVGQVREILDTEATRIVISTGATDWAVTPDATSYYVIGGGVTMTGTSANHAYVEGKRVQFLGLRHTGCTSYAIYGKQLAVITMNFNYCDSLVNGVAIIDTSIGASILLNYLDCSALGVYAQTATMTPRANLFNGCTTGAKAGRVGILHMSGSNQWENYFLGCTTDIQLEYNGGCLSASAQGSDGAIVIDPDPSENLPAWWT